MHTKSQLSNHAVQHMNFSQSTVKVRQKQTLSNLEVQQRIQYAKKSQETRIIMTGYSYH